MNKVLIFAGGVGTRMNSKAKPKQFLEFRGKPILVYTVEVFNSHPEVDEIVIVSLESAIDEVRKCIHRYDMNKVTTVVPGGATGFESILFGLDELNKNADSDDIVLIHDGVRPLIDEDTISKCIESAKAYGNGITAVAVTEGIIVSNNGEVVDDFPDRKWMYATKAPQAFQFGQIYNLYKQAKSDGLTPIESAHLCHQYGMKLHIVPGTHRNIKVTTATDYYIFRALEDAMENEQIIGY